MTAYSSNEIVDIILVLGEAGRNCRAKNCIVIDIRLNDIQMQIRRILLRKRIHKQNRKQINAEDDVNDL